MNQLQQTILHHISQTLNTNMNQLQQTILHHISQTLNTNINQLQSSGHIIKNAYITKTPHPLHITFNDQELTLAHHKPARYPPSNIQKTTIDLNHPKSIDQLNTYLQNL